MPLNPVQSKIPFQAIQRKSSEQEAMQSQKERKADIAKNIYPETCREISTTTNAVITS
jgi:uncharacterized protein YqfB (UPF0267 family)